MQNRQKRANVGSRNRLAVPVSDKLKGGNMYECYEVCSKGKNHCCCECNEKCEGRCVEEEGFVKYGDNPDGCFGLVKPDCEVRGWNRGNDEQEK